MEWVFGVIIFGTLGLGVAGGLLYLKAMKWGAAKQREVAIEQGMRQDIVDARSRKRAASKILREAGERP